MTSYSDKELRAEAVRAIRDDAKAASCRAKCVGYSLLLDGPHGTTLIAHGQRTDDGHGYRFDVNVAI
jgi:hypothetical protein